MSKRNIIDVLKANGMPDMVYSSDFSQTFVKNGLRIPSADEANGAWIEALELAASAGMPMAEIVTLVFLSKGILARHVRKYPDAAPVSTMSETQRLEIQEGAADLKVNFDEAKQQNAKLNMVVLSDDIPATPAVEQPSAQQGTA